jgi:hypothetical protein
VNNQTIISTICAIALAGLVGILVARDASHAPGIRRPLRLWQAVVCFYFVVLYSISLYSLFGYSLPERFLYYLRAGLFTRWGVILLLVVIASDVLTYFLRNRHAE